jgi:hypothetical protein
MTSWPRAGPTTAFFGARAVDVIAGNVDVSRAVLVPSQRSEDCVSFENAFCFENARFHRGFTLKPMKCSHIDRGISRQRGSTAIKRRVLFET